MLPRNSICFGSYSEPFRFTTGQQSCNNVASTNVPVAISGSGTPTVNSTITIPSGSNVTIADINITAQITHSWTADLIVTLISPTGTQIQLVNQQCGSSDNLNATFDDSGTTLVCGVNPAINGTIRPTQLLSALNGQDSQGVWTLRINDVANGDGGSMVSWSIRICSLPNVPIACGQISTTWNGTSWSNEKPTDNVAVTINGNYTSTEDLAACSLNIIGTSQVILSSGNDFRVEGIVNVAPTASFTIQNNANLIQTQNVVNTANATVFRNSNPLRRLDYTIWSSPVTGSQTLKQFSPNTVNNRFYNYNTSTNVYTVISDPLNQPFILGRGYLIRMPDNHPTSPTIWNGQFNGNLNNGTSEINLTYLGSGQSFNMIGNPYPSTINANAFITDNLSDITGTLYFWRKINAAQGTAYATYNLGGSTTTSPSSPTPNGFIQVGQGFFVEANNVTTPAVIFQNTQRTGNNANQFFRVNDIERNRIWLNLTNSSGLFSQSLIGYISNATSDYDVAYDAKYLNDSPVAFNSLLDNQEFSIQFRGLTFNSTDVFPMKFKTDTAGEYTIAIDHTDGIFATNQNVYLQDTSLQVVHNLSNSSYTYTSESGEYSNRFKIIFEPQALAVGDNPANENSVIAYTNNNQIHLNSSNQMMKKVKVYDVLGRTLYTNLKVENLTLNISTISATNQALFLHIELESGEIEIKKIMF